MAAAIDDHCEMCERQLSSKPLHRFSYDLLQKVSSLQIHSLEVKVNLCELLPLVLLKKLDIIFKEDRGRMMLFYKFLKRIVPKVQ